MSRFRCGHQTDFHTDIGHRQAALSMPQYACIFWPNTDEIAAIMNDSRRIDEEFHLKNELKKRIKIKFAENAFNCFNSEFNGGHRKLDLPSSIMLQKKYLAESCDIFMISVMQSVSSFAPTSVISSSSKIM